MLTKFCYKVITMTNGGDPNHNSNDTEENPNQNYIDHLGNLLSIVGILNTLMEPPVRANFVVGKIIQNVSISFPALLEGLDMLRHVLQPQWINRDSQNRFNAASVHLQRLYIDDSRVFMEEMEIAHMTYAEWNDILQRIATSHYWDKEYNEDRKSFENPAMTSMKNKEQVEPLMHDQRCKNRNNEWTNQTKPSHATNLTQSRKSKNSSLLKEPEKDQHEDESIASTSYVEVIS